MGVASKLWMHAKMLRFDRLAFQEDGPPPELCFEQSWSPDSNHLDSFLEICPGWRYPQVLPPTYPQVALAELHSKILADRAFPFNPMGIVHVSNHIQVHQPIVMSDSPVLDVRVALTNWQAHRRGRVFDIRTEISRERERVWESVATALVMQDKTSSDSSSKSLPAVSQPSEDKIHLSEDLGRRYAQVAGDYNPIHQRAWMAKPFGFKRAIIHGMWTLGWALHEPASRQQPGPLECTGHFKRPVSLPGEIWRKITNREQGGFDIQIFNVGSPKVSLELALSV